MCYWRDFIYGQGCCLEIWSECSDETTCSACLADHSFVDDDGLYSCKAGYYGNRPLNSNDYCLKCENDCFKCDNSSTCTVCTDQNAYPTLHGCMCKDGFYSGGNSSLVDNCKACNSECKTCNDDSSCIVCKLEIAIL